MPINFDNAELATSLPNPFKFLLDTFLGFARPKFIEFVFEFTAIRVM